MEALPVEEDRFFEPDIMKFTQYLLMEKGFSPHTVSGYRHDLTQFFSFYHEKGGARVDGVDMYSILGFMKSLKDRGMTQRTINRKLSAIRGFFHFLARQGAISNDPTEEIQTPHLRQALPHVISLQEVEKILEQPDTGTPKGIRDRAILELLYATGMRVSELVALPLQGIFWNEGFVKVFGKGSKERLIPVGRTAMEWLKTYCDDVRKKVTGSVEREEVFLSRLGRP
ncbi:MAG: site-specific tyrosine recombinase XerD, partial [Deltaproteobacteria bacterium]